MFNWLNQALSLILGFTGFKFFFCFNRDFCIIFALSNFMMKSEGDVKMEMLKNTMHYLSL